MAAAHPPSVVGSGIEVSKVIPIMSQFELGLPVATMLNCSPGVAPLMLKNRACTPVLGCNEGPIPVAVSMIETLAKPELLLLKNRPTTNVRGALLFTVNINRGDREP